MAVLERMLGATVDLVVQQDLSALTAEQLQEQVALAGPVSQRLAGYAALASAELTARTGGTIPTEDGGSRSVVGWVAETTGDSSSAAGRLIRIATALQQGLPRIAAAVLAGELPLPRAEVLTRLVGVIDPHVLAEAEPALLTTAQMTDPTGLAAYVRHQVATWVEPVLDADETTANNKRFLTTRREADGSLRGSFRLAAGDSESVLTALEPLARKTGDTDSRSAAQRRADALVDVCEQVLRHGKLPDAGGQRPQLAYVLPADWAARQADADRCADCTRCPQHAPPTFAELVAAGLPTTGSSPDARNGRAVVPAEHACAVAAWSGPQTRARIETILCDARITRVLLDPHGQVQGLESITDDVTPAQRRCLAARDLGCAVRGCTRPPAMCDAHHLTRRADGGLSTLANLVLLCRRHHVLWHLGKITLRHLHTPWLDQPWLFTPPDPPPARQLL
jgi:hypothetical protein